MWNKQFNVALVWLRFRFSATDSLVNLVSKKWKKGQLDGTLNLYNASHGSTRTDYFGTLPLFALEQLL